MAGRVIDEVIVLAGGFGTRLRSAVPDLPKPLAPVAGKPFLAWLLEGLNAQHVGRVVLAVHHLNELIEAEIGDRFGDMDIVYSREEAPMGTGGAVTQALALTKGARVAVLNGDTYLPVDLAAMAAATNDADIAMAVCEVDQVDRYGSVALNGRRVSGFIEKSAASGAGWINGGVYIVRRALPALQRDDAFSLERDVLQAMAETLLFEAFPVPGPFLDIGTPDDFARAQTLLPQWRGPR